MSSPNFTTLETPRLRLRPFTEMDLPIFIAYRDEYLYAILKEEWLRKSGWK